MLLFGSLLWTTGKGGFVPPPPPPPPTAVQPSGGYLREGRRRLPEELLRQRVELGILPAEALAAIQDVAAQQVERLEQDAQKQYDELANELALRRIEFQAGYLQVLASERERLIDAEIAARLVRKLRQRESEAILLTLIAAAASL